MSFSLLDEFENGKILSFNGDKNGKKSGNYLILLQFYTCVNYLQINSAYSPFY